MILFVGYVKMSNKKLLTELIKIYQPGTMDWMGFFKSPGNYFSYHHIEKLAEGGDKKCKNNGAILTVNAHRILHIAEIFYPDLYDCWTSLFIEINLSHGPLSEEHLAKIYYLKNETLNFIEEFNNMRIECGKKRILY